MFGLGPSARVFAKMMTAVIDYLRKTFIILLVAYINDLLIQAVDKQTCKLHAELVIIVLHHLGYGINLKKIGTQAIPGCGTPGIHLEFGRHDGIASSNQKRQDIDLGQKTVEQGRLHRKEVTLITRYTQERQDDYRPRGASSPRITVPASAPGSTGRLSAQTVA